MPYYWYKLSMAEKQPLGSDREKKTDRTTGKNKFSSSTKLLPSVTQENKKSLKVNFIIKNHFW